MDRHALGEFLRSRRERLRPADVGLVAGARRRTPGLRRDEVALLAAMSTDYYERIEQARGPHPSPEMLGAISRALRLTVDERDHVYRLAGQEPPAEALGWGDAGLMCVLDALAPTVPALVCDDLHDVVAQNPLNVALLGPLATSSGRDGNFLWGWFVGDVRARYDASQHAQLGREYAADLRVTWGRRHGDRAVTALVDDLCAASEEFRSLWADQEVAARHTTRKLLHHAEVGDLDLECEVVVSSSSGQRLVLFRPVPGSGTAERLGLLRVVGVQDLTAAR